MSMLPQQNMNQRDAAVQLIHGAHCAGGDAASLIYIGPATFVRISNGGGADG